MGTITVNVSNETENLFRKTVHKELGKGKGKLGGALDEAMKKWAEEKKQKEIGERLLKTMRKGFAMGKILYKHRSELYERKSFSS
ncbi:hypothetical protein HY837_02120 [archaeon]|nr:hypothetical protein [archaeon]